MALAAFRIWLREGDDWATHASYHRIVLEIRFRSWLGRKDSNLQPSDPESAALPLRHSPNARLSSVLGRLSSSRPAAHSKWPLRLRPLAPFRGSAQLNRPRAHLDGQGGWRTHQSIEGLLQQLLGPVEVDSPPNAEDPIAEQAF